LIVEAQLLKPVSAGLIHVALEFQHTFVSGCDRGESRTQPGIRVQMAAEMGQAERDVVRFVLRREARPPAV
jgi:hypothetical protein